MTTTAWGFGLALLPVLVGGYAYAGYPLLAALLAWTREAGSGSGDGVGPEDGEAGWPSVSVSLPARNEVGAIRETLEALTSLDYPKDRLQILVVSDASDDGTDDVVREFADRGVELLRMPERVGKTAAENAAAPHLRGEIVVNTDATIRIPPESLKPLIRAFRDPTVGVASGRDVSVSGRGGGGDRNVGEFTYVGYEMWLRRLETRAGGIVGASGCFYAIRRELHQIPVHEILSRDFAAPLTAREHGYRSVSVDRAVCLVPRTGSLRREFRRKVRTMARGLDTLFSRARLMNPFRYGRFSVMLVSHKLARWLVPLTVPPALVGLVLLARSSPVAVELLGLAALGACWGAAGLLWKGRRLPRPLAVTAYLVAGVVAGIVGWWKVLTGDRRPTWEPTRRDASAVG